MAKQNNVDNGIMNNGTQVPPQQLQGMPAQGAQDGMPQMDPGMMGNPMPQFQQGMPQQGFQGMPQAQQPQAPKMPISERIALAAYKGTKWVCEKIPVILGTAAVTVAGYCIYKGLTSSDEPQSPYTLPQQIPQQYPDNGYGYGYNQYQVPQQPQTGATISSEVNPQAQQPQMGGFEVNRF